MKVKKTVKVNIGNRLLGYMLNSRGSSDLPLISPLYSTPKGNFLVISVCEGGSPAIAGGSSRG